MIRLLPVTQDAARAVLAGGSPYPCVPDWPHADTVDALRPLAEHGPFAGTFVVLEDALVVGDCGWLGLEEDGTAEIGYGLAPSARGRGVMTAALELLLTWCAEQGAVRVRAEVRPGNAPSLRLLDRLGFGVIGDRAGHLALLLALS